MRRTLFTTSLLGLLLILTACGGAPASESSSAPAPKPEPTASAQPQVATLDSATADEDGNDTPLVLFLGDSLAAGYGLSEEQAFPALVQGLLSQGGTEVRVVNAGVSGDTTAGGLARIDWLLRQEPDVVVVELGGNDGLRGLDPEVSEKNLRTIIERSQGASAKVLLAGMQMPPNYGADYQRRFAELFPRLAKELDVALIPFLLEGVGGDSDLNLPDGIHPNAEGQKIVAETVTRYLAPLLD